MMNPDALPAVPALIASAAMIIYLIATSIIGRRS